MTYLQALEIAAKAATTLREQDGNLSSYEHMAHMSALALAVEKIKSSDELGVAFFPNPK